MAFLKKIHFLNGEMSVMYKFLIVDFQNIHVERTFNKAGRHDEKKMKHKGQPRSSY